MVLAGHWTLSRDDIQLLNKHINTKNISNRYNDLCEKQIRKNSELEENSEAIPHRDHHWLVQTA